jgi:hypothetical protein
MIFPDNKLARQLTEMAEVVLLCDDLADKHKKLKEDYEALLEALNETTMALNEARAENQRVEEDGVGKVSLDLVDFEMFRYSTLLRGGICHLHDLLKFVKENDASEIEQEIISRMDELKREHAAL